MPGSVVDLDIYYTNKCFSGGFFMVEIINQSFGPFDGVGIIKSTK